MVFRRVACLLATGILALWTSIALTAQEPTPITVQLVTSTPLPVMGAGPSLMPTPTLTETPLGPAQIEALTEVNVRAEASTDAARLGLIAPGERFSVVGRYFRWIQFRYPNSPTGLGWVYDELVEIIGDASLIPDLTIDQPTLDPVVAGATQTAQAIFAVPGGEMTATANARVLVGPVAIEPGGTPQLESNLNPQGAERLPTFTPAPNVSELVAQSAVQPTPTTESILIDLTAPGNSLPPIVPIVALIGFGVLGLLISFMRR